MQILLSDAPLKAKHVTVLLQCHNVIYVPSCAKQVSVLHWDATIKALAYPFIWLLKSVGFKIKHEFKGCRSQCKKLNKPHHCVLLEPLSEIKSQKKT